MRSLSGGVDVGPESVTSEVSPTDANELKVILFFKFGLSSNNNRVGIIGIGQCWLLYSMRDFGVGEAWTSSRGFPRLSKTNMDDTDPMILIPPMRCHEA